MVPSMVPGTGKIANMCAINAMEVLRAVTEPHQDSYKGCFLHSTDTLQQAVTSNTTNDPLPLFPKLKDVIGKSEPFKPSRNTLQKGEVMIESGIENQ